MKTHLTNFVYGTAPTPNANPTTAAQGSDTERSPAPRGLRRLGQAFGRRAPNAAPINVGGVSARTGSRQRLDHTVDARPGDDQFVGALGRQPQPAFSSEPTPMPPPSAREAPPRPFGSLPTTPSVPPPTPGHGACPPGAGPANTERTLEELAQGLSTGGQPGPSARNLSFWTYAQQDDARRSPTAEALAGRDAARGRLGSPIVLRDDALPPGRRAPGSPLPLFVGDANTSVGLELWRQPFALPELWDEDESDDDNAPPSPRVLSSGGRNDVLWRRLGPALELSGPGRRTPPEAGLRAAPPSPASPGEPANAAGPSAPTEASPTSSASSGGSSFGCAGALRFDAQKR